MENIKKELRDLNRKCDVIIEMLDRLSSDPDFVIKSLRSIAERQNIESKRKSFTLSMKRCNGPE